MVRNMAKKSKKIEYAGFWPRFGAHIIDNIVEATVPAIMGFGALFLIDTDPAGGLVLIFLALLLWMVLALINGWYLVAKTGSSLGKKSAGIKIQDTKGKNLSYGSAFVRIFIKKLCFFFGVPGALIYTIPLWVDKKEKKSLGDLVASSFVVEK